MYISSYMMILFVCYASLFSQGVAAEEPTISDVLIALEDSKPSFFDVYLVPIIPSVISAILFWYIFDYRSKKRDYDHARIKAYREMVNVASSVFSLLDLMCAHKKNSTSFFQDYIMSGHMGVKDYKKLLSVKVINKDYLYLVIPFQLVMVFGHEILKRRNRVLLSVEKLNFYYEYLSVEERVLFDSLLEALKYLENLDYFIDKNPISNGFAPVDNSMAMYAGTANNLNKLLIDIYRRINSIKPEKSATWSEVCRHFYSGNYRECIYCIERYEANVSSWDGFLSIFYVRSLYKLGWVERLDREVLRLCEKYNKNILGYRRAFLDMDEIYLRRILSEKVNSASLESLVKTLQSEADQKKSFLSECETVRNYLDQGGCS